MSRAINFSPGPATLPLRVLEEVRDELVDFGGSGVSILEHSHRGKDYEGVHAAANGLLKELLGIPDTHTVLWMQGGASGQFALLPMNFLQGKTADYVNTGSWSKKAFEAANFYGKARWAATGKEGSGFVRAPMTLDVAADAEYVHLTSNATIMGVQYDAYPDSAGKPLVADMSSDLLWKPIDVSKFALIYAGAQKNLGPAGVTLVIAEKDFIAKGADNIPEIFRYSYIAENDSLQNTPPTFAIYMVGKVLQWVKDNGGAAGMEKRNRSKGEMLYGLIDQHPDFFRCPVEKGSRSVMNAVFRLPTEELEAKFLAETKKAGMLNLKGHRSVGGIRVSMYNAMEPEGVAKLVEFMETFRKANA
ncbi:MAG: 3-phosphoserine/phosphohydroxythreonine transaminase [Sandaracinus sp.]|nr:3-phosphoserine/phosphohydroxythreonine transaminase [Sandaracinus sp.]